MIFLINGFIENLAEVFMNVDLMGILCKVDITVHITL